MTTFCYRFSVRLHDVDAAGILFFANLFRYAHDAYEEWMASIDCGLSAMLANGIARLPLVHAEADYLEPIRHGETITIDVAVVRLGKRSFTVGYRFLARTQSLKAKAKTVHVYTEAEQTQSQLLPPWLAKAIGPYFQQV